MEGPTLLAVVFQLLVLGDVIKSSLSKQIAELPEQLFRFEKHISGSSHDLLFDFITLFDKMKHELKANLAGMCVVDAKYIAIEKAIEGIEFLINPASKYFHMMPTAWTKFVSSPAASYGHNGKLVFTNFNENQVTKKFADLIHPNPPKPFNQGETILMGYRPEFGDETVSLFKVVNEIRYDPLVSFDIRNFTDSQEPPHPLANKSFNLAEETNVLLGKNESERCLRGEIWSFENLNGMYSQNSVFGNVLGGPVINRYVSRYERVTAMETSI